MKRKLSGSEIRESFIEFFKSKGHTFVPSSSLVPTEDPTLLFTNAGMVQFKDIFLGLDKRLYTRAVNSQKCMRVAGKHNDLDDVGRDDTHHTFFEMLGNWSFGDYYKKEAISWAWELLTEVWHLDKSRLWATCFEDEKGEIPKDEEAYHFWALQPGMEEDRILYDGRKDNFWEMADTGPSGPCSEIHYDLGPEYCNLKDLQDHVCRVNGDCSRFLEFWNLVFIQYNRIGPSELELLPSKHVDTGMGLERIVSILQSERSNYSTDLFSPLMDKVQEITEHSDRDRELNITPYRVIADHARAASFLIADRVVPGNTGRNYICRMIIRRASLFGKKIGMPIPFLAKIADVVIEIYGDAYPELFQNRQIILENLNSEEKRFQDTLESGLDQLDELVAELEDHGDHLIEGKAAFNLYATHGLPLEITKDIAHEKGIDVDEAGFREAMEEHKLASGGGKALGQLGGEDAEKYRHILNRLIESGKLDAEGVIYNPYGDFQIDGEILSMLKDGVEVPDGIEGDQIDLIIPESPFYLESGGQVSDTGKLIAQNDQELCIQIHSASRPAAGVFVLHGVIDSGRPKVGDKISAIVDVVRRKNIMRNHSATHLLHAELRSVLGLHVQQSGSLVAPDYLRFDFNHPKSLSAEQLDAIEAGVNRAILSNYRLNIAVKSLQQAKKEGAIALFDEKYSDEVRTVSIGSEKPFSYELCGGTHVHETGEIGIFLITSESSIAAGVRRIEAVTGEGSYEYIKSQYSILHKTAGIINSTISDVPDRVLELVSETDLLRKQIEKLKHTQVNNEFHQTLEKGSLVDNLPVFTPIYTDANANLQRQMIDKFKNIYPTGIIVSGSVVAGNPLLVASVSDDLVKMGLHAGDLVKSISKIIGGGGGGTVTLAQAGGKYADQLEEALSQVQGYVIEKYNG
ncbi:MAG: alanine--tRNA ligase [Anaerolineaceae bacterium]|nr:alanine--tRNA ligase [Anaerolineaceae bacterium]